MATSLDALQMDTSGTETSSQQTGVGAMASSIERLASQGWTDRVRLQVISKVGGVCMTPRCSSCQADALCIYLS